MRVDILTLFPEMFPPVLGHSIIGRARKKGLLQVCCHQLRDFSPDPRGRVEVLSTIREMKGEQPPNPLPPIDLLEKPSAERGAGTQEEMQQNAKTLEETLKSFGVQVRLLDVKRGPSVTR